MTDLVKIAAKTLQQGLELNPGEKIGSSHSHAAVAGFLGFNSKKALLDWWGGEVDDEYFIWRYSERFSENKLAECIDRMKSTPLKRFPISLIADVILYGLTPECECCGKKDHLSAPVFVDATPTEPDGWVCDRCLMSDYDHEHYDHCIYCGDGITYRASVINSDGECPMHFGEGYMDEEEREGWESYIENITKDL